MENRTGFHKELISSNSNRRECLGQSCQWKQNGGMKSLEAISAFCSKFSGRILLFMISCLTLLIYSCGGSNESSSIDNSPPAVVSLNPVDGAVNIPTNAHISITFNKPGVPIKFSVNKGDRKDIDCAMSASGTTYTLVPLSDLSAGTTYVATVISLDSSGGDQTFTWSFTTAGPPTVVGTICYDIFTKQPPMFIAFSALMDPSTINSSTVNVISSSNTGEIQVPVQITGSGKYYGVTLPIYYPNLTITITTGVKNVAGNAMAANFTQRVEYCPGF